MINPLRALKPRFKVVFQPICELIHVVDAEPWEQPWPEIQWEAVVHAKWLFWYWTVTRERCP